MAKLRTWALGHRFHCPACDVDHFVRTGDAPVPWGFNGDVERPTFTPSVLVTYDGPDAGQDRGYGRAPPARCHSLVVDGDIKFLTDCTHSLAGQTVPLPEIAAGDP